ncbi:hypothetical protein [Xylella fastidiosa]|nr:hypothetical protein [Xylella fastidiosa]
MAVPRECWSWHGRGAEVGCLRYWYTLGGVSVSSGMFDDGFGGDGLMLWQWYAAGGGVCCTVEADRG